MAASINDKLTDVRNAARPNSARVSSPRTTGGATLVCDNLTGWPTASKVHFVTYKIDSSSNVVAGTQLDCYGIVSGNSITSFTVVDGTDVGHAVNDVVEMLPTAAWGQDLADGLNVQHNRTGTHKSITTDTIATTGNATVGGNETVAGTLAVTGATTLTGAVGGAGYDVKTITNSCKFSVYQTNSQSISALTTSKVTLDTKSFDTSSNFDVVTNHRFVAPVAGFYLIHGCVQVSNAGMTSGVVGIAFLFVNGSEARRGAGSVGTGNTNNLVTSSVTGILQLAANDYVELYAYNGEASSARNTGVGSNLTYMSGFLMSAT